MNLSSCLTLTSSLCYKWMDQQFFCQILFFTFCLERRGKKRDPKEKENLADNDDISLEKMIPKVLGWFQYSLDEFDWKWKISRSDAIKLFLLACLLSHWQQNSNKTKERREEYIVYLFLFLVVVVYRLRARMSSTFFLSSNTENKWLLHYSSSLTGKFVSRYRARITDMTSW